jgi:hypothetical protein
MRRNRHDFLYVAVIQFQGVGVAIVQSKQTDLGPREGTKGREGKRV